MSNEKQKRAIPKVLQPIDGHNKGYKVKLRYRRTKNNGLYNLYLDYYDKGTRKTKSIGLQIVGDRNNYNKDNNVIKMALHMRNQMEREVLEGNTGVITTKPKTIDFIKFFEDYSKTKRDSNYRISCDHFKNYIRKDRLDIKQVDLKLCEGYKNYLLSLDVSKYTAFHYLVTFKATLNYAVELGHIPKNPAKKLSIKYEIKRIERLTLDELRKLNDTECINRSLKNGFLFACFTGLRYSDLVNVKYSDIDKDHLKFTMQKTSIEIEVKLNDNAKKIVEEQKKHKKDEYIFHIPSGGSRSRALKKWLEDAGIKKDLTFHCSRHTFGCLLIENGVDVFTVQKLMGHREVKTTLQYVDKVDETRDKGIDRLPLL